MSVISVLCTCMTAQCPHQRTPGSGTRCEPRWSRWVVIRRSRANCRSLQREKSRVTGKTGLYAYLRSPLSCLAIHDILVQYLNIIVTFQNSKVLKSSNPKLYQNCCSYKFHRSYFLIFASRQKLNIKYYYYVFDVIKR